MGDYKAAELPLMHQHLLNVENMIDPARTIWIFDQGYTAMEVYARIIEMNSYFIVRLKIDSYKEERKNITADRLKKFHDPELKNIYSKEWKMDLRIVIISTTLEVCILALSNTIFSFLSFFTKLMILLLFKVLTIIFRISFIIINIAFYAGFIKFFINEFDMKKKKLLRIISEKNYLMSLTF